MICSLGFELIVSLILTLFIFGVPRTPSYFYLCLHAYLILTTLLLLAFTITIYFWSRIYSSPTYRQLFLLGFWRRHFKDLYLFLAVAFIHRVA
jgi:hypothetical protein